ncbi:hypothetical protein PhaeoP23_03742 (plasmid) [Phaeobacter piscinae]|uniref:HNH endonuclease n=1 Tax=Phaeobacter piscinae TaxID=1580596 RepID=A0ABM6PJG0_9RHOB|nr:endonuclease [Phaeobacter piscinae]ATG37819.1 hypothetical protein PhaeoP36_03742 [Phaeobacter piscinae]AUQ88340.1 hypothetical protein PhaeoP42_03743 [Phaeobacter piscinae]AUR26223.1 hypothetical protein PhaeoP23_03742 [Phaeobacter piscinae]
MIAVDRSGVPVPTILSKVYAKDGKTELERAIAHFIDEEMTTKFDFDRYSASEVKQALDTIFHGKCAYCESFYAKTQPVDVEHYRPKGSVDDASSHRGYWWLAMDWDNLLPSCIDCNRRRGQRTPKPEEDGSMVAMNEQGDFARGKTFNSGKQAAFPLVAGSPRASWDKTLKAIDVDLEQRLLLDPTRDDPTEHLVFHVDRSAPEKLVSFVYPKPIDPAQALLLPILGDPAAVGLGAGQSGVSAIGAVSIQVYGLNRLSLVQARTKVLRDLEFLLEHSASLLMLQEEIDERREARGGRIAAATGTEKQALLDDDALDHRISAQLGSLAHRTIDQIYKMASPKEQFTSLVRAWIDAYLG